MRLEQGRVHEVLVLGINELGTYGVTVTARTSLVFAELSKDFLCFLFKIKITRNPRNLRGVRFLVPNFGSSLSQQ